MTRVAFGPRTDAPSWDWVGVGTARALARHYEVVLFDDFSRAPDADIVVTVKQRPPDAFVEAVLGAGARLVHLPIDRYRSEREIRDEAPFLRACDLVLLHSGSLLPYVAPHCLRVGVVEHHARDALETRVGYRERGFLLWVGGCQHVPHVLKWLEENPVQCEVRLLTDLFDKRARLAAHAVAHGLGLRLAFAEGSVNGVAAAPWSPSLQRELMATCKAAFDIKGVDFNQTTKPPTKAQQFIVSGIPFGCLPGGSVPEYFEGLGFRVADMADPGRLFSREYWEETRAFSDVLRRRTSIEAVGLAYRTMFDGMLDAPVLSASSSQAIREEKRPG